MQRVHLQIVVGRVRHRLRADRRPITAECADDEDVIERRDGAADCLIDLFADLQRVPAG